MKMGKHIKRIWSDAVWSKVISAMIIAAVALIFTTIKGLVSQVGFKVALLGLLNYEIKVWTIALAALGLLVCWLAYYLVGKSFSYDEAYLEVDRKLFDRIRNSMLTQTEAISSLRFHDFTTAFYSDWLTPLYDIKSENSKSDFEFFHPKVEQLKNKLLTSIVQFTGLIGANTFRLENSYSKRAIPEDWEYDHPEQFWQAVNSIHRAQKEVCKNYDKFIKEGRRILKV
ncbi:MAG: hypothetical protein LBR55_06965 [Bacteroidales bacterium]|jgi:hypothetical protein|nr:hypothetical protein [Bacteroidales bacterium]